MRFFSWIRPLKPKGIGLIDFKHSIFAYEMGHNLKKYILTEFLHIFPYKII